MSGGQGGIVPALSMLESRNLSTTMSPMSTWALSVL